MTTSLTDGSWELKVMISDLQTERSLRVHGSIHVGALMLKLVDSLNVARDWSDFGLFWIDKNSWLTRTKTTLDQLGVTSTSNIMFTPMSKPLVIALPDLHTINTHVDFSANVFSVVAKLCAELGIRHFEELSLCGHLSNEELKKNRGISATRRTYFGVNVNGSDLPNSPNRLSNPSTPQGTLGHRSTSSMQRTTPTHLSTPSHQSFSPSLHCSPASTNSFQFDADSTLVTSSKVEDFKPLLHFPKNLAEKARINAGWLDSSRSLLEQGVNPDDLLLLKFKFHNFHDLNAKFDQVRINQLYEQAKWSMVSEEIDCTEEEMTTLAALQLQIEHQASQPPTTTIDAPTTATDHTDDDEIDAALDDLQTTLEGSSYPSHNNGDSNRSSDLTHIPELKAIMKFYKTKKFGLRSSQKHLFVLRETTLLLYDRKHQEQKKALLTLQLQGCEVTADVNVSSQKFMIKVLVPSSQQDASNFEYCLRPDSEKSYAEWMAALKLATQGRSMADSCYESEVQAIVAFLQIHHPSPSPHNKTNASSLKEGGFNIEYYVAPRFVNKLKGTNQLIQRILDAQMNIGHLGVAEAKMSYIRLWQSLPEYALTYFIVKHKNAKKEELLAITPSRLMRMDLLKGDVIKSWPFQSLESWNVNWEIKQVQVCMEGEDLRFQCLTADCKVVHEFIGGYIFLSMRSNDSQQPLDHALFHKLTSGWE